MRTLLLLLLAFIGLSAAICGLIMIARPDGSMLNLPASTLDTTPFKNLLIPGIILAFVVGGINLLAGFFCIRQHTNQYKWAIAGGIMICGWIIGQMILVQTANWLQFIYLISGILIILVSYQLMGKWAV